MGVLDQMRKVWNIFRSNEEAVDTSSYSLGLTNYSNRSPDRSRYGYFNDKSIVASINTRIAIDVAAVAMRHVKVDAIERYVKDVDSSLNDLLKFQPNIDQLPRHFRQDVVACMLDDGIAAIVPVEITGDPASGKIDIVQLRVGKIVSWHPYHVRVSVFNQDKGKREEVNIDKKIIAIIENPLYAVMNEPNGTLQRLIRKLSLLDTSDEQSASGNLDLIIQLPYVIKSEARKNQAEQRRKDIEFQLKSSQYGIAYTDGTEKITQLNRPAENNLLKQVEYLTGMLYGELGITEEVMKGTADEQTMINYYDRTIEPILDSITEAMQMAFLGFAGIKKGERIQYFKDPFRLVPVGDVAEIADKFIRNQILTANEFRGFLGIPPSPEPQADKLLNPNVPQPSPETNGLPAPTDVKTINLPQEKEPVRKELQNGSRL